MKMVQSQSFDDQNCTAGGSLQVIRLDEEQIRQIYNQHISRDFPPSERRSLKNLLLLLERGEYECLGAFDESRLMGYAFFVRHEKDLLLDYFAVTDGQRGRGIGSQFLQLIGEYFADADSLIAEIDDPDAGVTEQERAHRLRRKAFYARNGFRDTGARVRTFGVPYQLIECGKNTHSAEETCDLYAMHYRHILPKAIYNRVIRF